MDTDEKTSSMREDRERGERTKHATLARQTAGGQRRLRVVVTVVCADVVPKVGGATGHPEGWGTEEARAERACVEEPWECGGEEVKGWVKWTCEGWEFFLYIFFNYTLNGVAQECVCALGKISLPVWTPCKQIFII